MASMVDDNTLTSTNHSMNLTDDTNVLTTPSNDFPGLTNVSHREGCKTVIFSMMEYKPWNNPDNIVSAEVEALVRQIKTNALFLFFLIGVPANAINLAVFYKQGLRDRVNLCLFALSLADILHLILHLLLSGEQLILQFTTKEKVGPVETFLVNHNGMVVTSFHIISPLLSAIIATERCLCVVNPIAFRSLLRTRTMAVAIVVVYVLVIALRLLVSFRYRVGCAFDPTTGIEAKMHIESQFFKDNRQFLDYLENFVFGLGLPGFVIVVVTSTTIITVIKLRHAMTWRTGTSSSISEQEVALTKMLVGNSVFFIVNTLPIGLFRFIRLSFPEISHGRRNHNFFQVLISLGLLLSLINATFNIVIYYVMGSRYRQTFWTLFGKTQKSAEK